MGRYADPAIRLRGGEPAQRRQTAAARREAGLAAGKGRVIVGEPALGQRLAKARFHIRPEEALGLADMGLAQTGLADQGYAQPLGDDPPRGPGAVEIARYHRVEPMGAQLL